MFKNRFSSVGFTLAAIGSTIGLGNIWKFPYITGENGGGAFVFVYLITILLIGMSVFIAETYLGYTSKKDPVSTFEVLSVSKNKRWRWAGLSLITGFLILTFYAVVIGWIIHYIYMSVFGLSVDLVSSEALFDNFLKFEIYKQIFYYTIVLGLVAFILSKGVKQGIEKLNIILIPFLFIILMLLLAYSVSLSGFGEAMSFLFIPNFDNFKSSSIIVAVGHAFFTLSIGMVVIMSYASSLGKEINIVSSSLKVVLADTIIALIAGIIIFTILFTYSQEPSKGAGLVFITLPAIFTEMGSMGAIMSILFFIALFFAGLTSAVSLLEPTILYVCDKFKITRKKATYSLILIIYPIGVLALLSNTQYFASSLTFGSKNLFDLMDFVTTSIMLPIGGIVTAIFIGFYVDQDKLETTLTKYMRKSTYKMWRFSIRYLAPFAIIVLMLNELGILAI